MNHDLTTLVGECGDHFWPLRSVLNLFWPCRASQITVWDLNNYEYIQDPRFRIPNMTIV